MTVHSLPFLTAFVLCHSFPSLFHPPPSAVTTRAHVHYVVTEHGIAYLWGKSLRERAQALIKIAAPEHRDALTAAAKARHIL